MNPIAANKKYLRANIVRGLKCETGAQSRSCRCSALGRFRPARGNAGRDCFQGLPR